jgi:hypothetical protein
MPARRDNWPDLLAQFIEQRRNVPFKWGKVDCCLFAADWVLLATNLDPASNLRGKYDSALGARRIIKRNGGLDAMVANALISFGFRQVDLLIAGRGDIIVRDSGNGDCAGVVLGLQSAFVGGDGLKFLNTQLQADSRIWRI